MEKEIKKQAWKRILNEIYLIAPNKYTEDEKFNRNTENHVIAKKLNLRPQDFSEGVSFLEEHGLIEIKKHPNYSWWVLTEKGFNIALENERNYKKEKSDSVIQKATVVLALVGFVQAIVYFMQFSKEVNNISSWAALVIIGMMVIIIFRIAWDSFRDLSKIKT